MPSPDCAILRGRSWNAQAATMANVRHSLQPDPLAVLGSLSGVAGSLSAISGTGLGEDIGQVAADRVVTDAEFIPNLAVRAAMRDEPQHFRLPL